MYNWRRRQTVKWINKNFWTITWTYFSYVPLIGIAIFEPYFVLAILVFIVVHELGHAVIAKIDHSLVGYQIIPTPGCRIIGKVYHGNALILPMGMLFSFLTYPLFMVQGFSFLWFYIAVLMTGIGDIWMMIKYFRGD